MLFGGVKNPSGLQEKQISIKAREVPMVRKGLLFGDRVHPN